MPERLRDRVYVVLPCQKDEDIALIAIRTKKDLEDGPDAGVGIIVWVDGGVVDLNGVLPAADEQNRASANDSCQSMSSNRRAVWPD